MTAERDQQQETRQVRGFGLGRVWWSVIALSALALMLHLMGQSTRPLWLDEACTHWTIQASTLDILQGARTDGYPPLYFILVQLVTSLVGDGELGLRAVSLLASVAMVPFGFVVTRRFASDRAALIAASLFCLSPLVQYYSVEARNYSLVQFLVLPTMWLLERGIRNPRSWLAWGGVTACLTVLLYTHNWAVFLLPAPVIGAFLVARQDRLRSALPAMLSVVTAFVLYLPWYQKAKASSVQGVGEWIVGWWNSSSPEYAILRSLESFGFGAAYPTYMTYLGQGPDLRILSILLTGTVIAAALWFTVRGACERRVWTLWSMCLVPLVSGWIYSYAVQPVYLIARYDTIALAPFLMLFALGIDGLLTRCPRCGWAVPVLVVTLAAVTLSSSFGDDFVADTLDVGAVEFLTDKVQDRDTVVAFGLRRAVVEYYLNRAGKRPSFRSFPQHLAEHPGWMSFARLQSSQEELAARGKTLAGELRQLAKSGRSVWILGSPKPMDGMVDKHVQQALRGLQLGRSDPTVLVFELKIPR